MVLCVIAMHDYKNHVQFMRMREKQSCMIYLIFKIDFLILNLQYVNSFFIFSLINKTSIQQGI